jgi:hypothetical protein
MIVGLLVLLLAGMLVRSPLLRILIRSRVERFNHSWHARLVIDRASFRGISTVYLSGITLKPAVGDTLLKIDTLIVSVNPWKILAGRISLSSLEIRNILITAHRQDSLTNYMFLLSDGAGGTVADTTIGAGANVDVKVPEADSTGSLHQPPDYAKMVSRIARLVFDLVPHGVTISNFDLKVRADGHRVRFRMAELELRDHFFHVPLNIQEDTASACWIVAGRLDYSARTIAFRIYRKEPGTVTIPYIGFRWNTHVRFDTLSFSISEKEQDDGHTAINGYASLSNFSIDQERIATQPVTFEKLAADYVINIGSDFAELDSATTITFNRISLHPYLRYRPKPTRQITLRIHKPEFSAQDLFSSLPEALFENMQGIKAHGNLSWYLDFFVDLAQPDSLEFATDLVRHHFSVRSYGNANLTRINEPFVYTAYEHGNPVRVFEVGPANPNFRTLDRISPFLRSAVLTSEDGGFFLHGGFIADAFRESIITNIKERRFARGGSTISMQLVKNVFLNRNKTIARKLEEALIVWLIESQHLSTKERMFEVYLNIIEWGPLIYGAAEASHFYFNKEPSRLTLAEAIYLASIIPHPKWFRSDFENGHLRPSNAGFYNLVSTKMLNKGWITPHDAEHLVPDVALKGPARLMLKRDTIIQ